MATKFLQLKDLEDDIKAFLGGSLKLESKEEKIAIAPPNIGSNPGKSIDFLKDCHISIFETSLLFPTGSNRLAFIVSIDNCSCLENAPEYNCYTIGKSQQGANGLIVAVILSDNPNCRYRVISELLVAITKAIDILHYFKGNNWNCHNC